ncbi:MAG TPA: cache domain-containing protein, partial [Paenibacillus sp.]|nr:cache domain-containing protein [Paenibacillus sp.]
MRRSLFGQIYLYFIVVILLSILGVGVVSYIQSSRALDDQVERYIGQLIRHSTSQTESYLRRYELASDSLLSEDAVKQFMELDPEDSYRFYELTQTIQKNLFRKTFIAYPSVHSITIVGDHGKAVIDDNQNWSTYTDFDPRQTLEYITAKVPADGKIAIFRDDGEHDRERTITIARRIRGFASYQPKGILAMEIKTEQMAPLWDMADLGPSATFFIADESGRIVYEPSTSALTEADMAAALSRLTGGTERSEIIPLGGEPTLFVARESD